MNLTLRIHSSVITLQQWELSISSLNPKLNFLRKFQFYLILNYRQNHDIFDDIHSVFKYLLTMVRFYQNHFYSASRPEKMRSIPVSVTDMDHSCYSANELSSSSSSIINSKSCSSNCSSLAFSSFCSFMSFIKSSLRLASYKALSASACSISARRGCTFSI